MLSSVVLQNNCLRLKPAVLRGASSGITQPEALIKYRGLLPTLGEVYPFLADRRLFARHKKFIMESRPFVTRTHVAFSRMPLGESIETDGKKQFLVDRSDNSVWRFQLDSSYLKSKNIRMSDSGVLFVVEENYWVNQDGVGRYTTLITNPLQNLKSGVVPSANCWGDTAELAILFGESGKQFVHDVYAWFHPNGVKVGAASTGSNHGFNFKYASVPVRPDALFSALIYE